MILRRSRHPRYVEVTADAGLRYHGNCEDVDMAVPIYTFSVGFGVLCFLLVFLVVAVVLLAKRRRVAN
jgi:hypothetical protein